MPRKDPLNQRSCPCNGILLKQRRQQRGWTQEELAVRSGYSLRLVAKAESGGSIQFTTLEHLAETLSTPESPLHPADLSCNPKQLALEFTRAVETYQEELVPRCRHFIDENIVFSMSGDPNVLPFAGEHHGIDAMDRANRIFFDFMKIQRIEIAAVVAEDNEVVITSWINGGLKDFPTELDESGPALVITRFLFERGKLVRLWDEYQPDAAERGALEQIKLLNELGGST